MGRAARAAGRRAGRVQRAGGRHGPGVLRGRHGARVPHQPDAGAAPRQRAAGGRGRQRQTVAGPPRRVHRVPGAVPGAADARVRRARAPGRPGRAVRQGRPQGPGRHVPDDRLAGVRRAVPGAHQRHAGQRPGAGPVRRRRDRPRRADHRAGGNTCT